MRVVSFKLYILGLKKKVLRLNFDNYVLIFSNLWILFNVMSSRIFGIQSKYKMIIYKK